MRKTLQKSYPELAKKIDLPGIWIKHEYLNEAGSHKIRLMEYLISNYLKKGQKKFVVSSSGNAGIAAAYFLNKTKLTDAKLKIFVSPNISEEKIKRLNQAIKKNKNIELKKVLRPKQSAFILAKKEKFILLRGSLEKNSSQAYYPLAQELIKIPNLQAVFIPTSSGVTALGLGQEFRKLRKKIEIHIVQTEKIYPMAREFDHCFVPKKSSLASAIVDKTALRKKETIREVENSFGSGWIISDSELKKAKKILEENTDLKMPSYDALLSLAGIIKAQEKKWPFKGNVCCLFTGR